MAIKRHKPVPIDEAKAEAIIEAAEKPLEKEGEGNKEINNLKKENISLSVKNIPKKEKSQPVSLQINEHYHNQLKKYAAKKDLKLYEVYNHMIEYFLEDLSRFDTLVSIKKSTVTLYNCPQGWKIACPLCGKEGVIKDPDGSKFVKFKKDLVADCPKCKETLHISGIEM
jgi:hypothetical protein